MFSARSKWYARVDISGCPIRNQPCRRSCAEAHLFMILHAVPAVFAFGIEPRMSVGAQQAFNADRLCRQGWCQVVCGCFADAPLAERAIERLFGEAGHILMMVEDGSQRAANGEQSQAYSQRRQP
jgi:hypothetical protein